MNNLTIPNITFQLDNDPMLEELRLEIEKEASESDDSNGFKSCFLLTRTTEKTSVDLAALAPSLLINIFIQSLNLSLKTGALKDKTYWPVIDARKARKRIVKLITQGLCCEPPVLEDNEKASNFVNRLLYAYSGAQIYTNYEYSDSGFTNKHGWPLFDVGSCDSEYFIFVATERIGILSFVGWD